MNAGLRRWRSGEARKVLWIELFYDLIFVATIIQLGNLLSHDVSWRGVALYALVFVPVWWSWSGMMFLFNRFIGDDRLQRLLVLLQMFAIALLATQVGGAFAAQSAGFAVAYAGVRGVLLLLYARVWSVDPETRPLVRGYLAGFGVAWLLWLGSLAVPEPWRFGVWAMAMLVELATPLVPALRRLQHRWSPDLHHMAERFALFTLIVLGESFIKVLAGLVGHAGSLDAVLLSAASFTVVGVFWWWYFDHAHHALRGEWPAARYLWIYGHLPLTVAVVAIGVGLKKLVLLELAAPMALDLGWMLVGASLLALIIFAVWERLRAFASGDRGWRFLLVATCACASLVALGLNLGALSVGVFVGWWVVGMLGFLASKG